MLTLFISYGIIQLSFFSLAHGTAGAAGDTQLPSTTSQCNHFDRLPMDTCLPNSETESYKYHCIDENTVEDRLYTGSNCDEAQLTDSRQYECTADNNCFCSAGDESACDVVDLTITECDNSAQFSEIFVANECLSGGGGSYLFHCNENGVFVWQSYDNVNCQVSESYTEEVYPTSCQPGSDFAVTCSFQQDKVQESVDRITSDCAGNEMKREIVTIDECQFEAFPNGPSAPYRFFCDDNNQLGLKYYTRGVGNCNGDVDHEYILDSAGQCVDGLIFSSTCGGIPVEPMQSVQRITLDCAGNVQESADVTTNQCQFEPFPNGAPRPYKYFCDDNNQLGLKYYTRGDENCNGQIQIETILDSAGQCVDGFVFASTCGGVPVSTEQPTTTVVTRLCAEELYDFNVGAVYQGTGGCQEHFAAFLHQDGTGSASFSDCLAKCREYECKSFSFGRKGVSRENYCNLYSVECTLGDDHHWYMFIPINNAVAMCNTPQ